jgi:hypothetical protein
VILKLRSENSGHVEKIKEDFILDQSFHNNPWCCGQSWSSVGLLQLQTHHMLLSVFGFRLKETNLILEM